MSESRRSSAASADSRDMASLPSADRAEEKKSRVLIRRATLLTAIAVTIAVAVGLSVFCAAVLLRPFGDAAGNAALLAAAIAALASVAAGLASARLLGRRIMAPALVPVAKLRDVAVAMAEGARIGRGSGTSKKEAETAAAADALARMDGPDNQDRKD